MSQGRWAPPTIQHRGDDPKAIAIGESLGLSFDGMMADSYQFTVQQGPPSSKDITFYVKDLSEVEGRLKEKFEEFGVKSGNPMKSECAWLATSGINNIRYLDHLRARSRRADEFGFDGRLAHESLDDLKRTITKAGHSGYLPLATVSKFDNKIETVRSQMPAKEYIPREDYEKIPSFDQLADEFAMLAIEAVVNCECHPKEE